MISSVQCVIRWGGGGGGGGGFCLGKAITLFGDVKL